LNVNLKQTDYSHEVELHGYKFKIRPFPAFTAMNMSGEVISFLSPLLSVIAPLLASDDTAGVMNANINTTPVSLVSGDRLEIIIRKLLVNHNNIIVEIDGSPEPLNFELANEVFCGQAQDMYVLAYEVISVNFPGIFGGLNNLFGKVGETIAKKTKLTDTAHLTQNNSVSLS